MGVNESNFEELLPRTTPMLFKVFELLLKKCDDLEARRQGVEVITQ